MESGTTMQTERTVVLGVDFIKTIDGILKVVEVVVSFIAFICAVVWGWLGMGFVAFVSFTSFINVLIILIFHIVGLYGKAQGPWLLIEFIFYCVFCLFWLIAFIISCVYAPHVASAGAAAFFSVGAFVVFAIDTFFQFRTWRFSSGGSGGPEAAPQGGMHQPPMHQPPMHQPPMQQGPPSYDASVDPNTGVHQEKVNY